MAIHRITNPATYPDPRIRNRTLYGENFARPIQDRFGHTWYLEYDDDPNSIPASSGLQRTGWSGNSSWGSEYNTYPEGQIPVDPMSRFQSGAIPMFRMRWVRDDYVEPPPGGAGMGMAPAAGQQQQQSGAPMKIAMSPEEIPVSPGATSEAGKSAAAVRALASPGTTDYSSLIKRVVPSSTGFMMRR